MNIGEFFAANIPLFAVCAAVLFFAIRNAYLRKGESVCFIIFTAIVLILSVVVRVEAYAAEIGNVILATIFTSIGYTLRPILVYLFVLIGTINQVKRRKSLILFAIPLWVNAAIYLLPFVFGIPVIQKLVFYYEIVEGGAAEFYRGSFLNFSSHITSLLYLGLLLVMAMMRFRGKHRRDGIIYVIVGIIIITTVLVEMFASRTDLLNIVSEICALINYAFIISVNTSRDPLTGLYDRRTFYKDVDQYKNQINGIVQIDMNELKYVNDNLGHKAGDEALQEIASVLEKCINSSTMCTYRLSGDEFLILMYQGKKEQLEETVSLIKEKMDDTDYSIAIGYKFFEKNETLTFEEEMKLTEDLMYVDKAHHYEESGHDRRKR